VVDVRLVDLEVIKRYSLAVRRDTVPAGELLDALDASRAVVVAAMAANGEVEGAAPPPVRSRRAPGSGDAATRTAPASDPSAARRRPADEGS
jgi:hypothetical protein